MTCRLHDVEPLEGLEMLPVSQLSRLVASKALRTVPYPLLGENTLCIADSMCLAPDEDGKLALLFRYALDCVPPVSHCCVGSATKRILMRRCTLDAGALV